MDCKCGCGQQIEEKPGGHRQRLFVDDAHKMRWHRQQQQNDQQEALLAELAELRTKVSDQAHTIELMMPVNSVQRKSYTEVLGELIDLRTKVSDQAHTIEEQASEISRLHDAVNVEYRYLEEYDSKKYNFKAWLKKKHLSSALIEKMLANSHFFRTSQETRKHYEYFLHVSLHCTDEEMEDFTRLWKMMLLRP